MTNARLAQPSPHLRFLLRAPGATERNTGVRDQRVYP